MCLRLSLVLFVTAAVVTFVAAKKKNVVDYNDADVERIFREWEVSISIIKYTRGEPLIVVVNRRRTQESAS